MISRYPVIQYVTCYWRSYYPSIEILRKLFKVCWYCIVMWILSFQKLADSHESDRKYDLRTGWLWGQLYGLNWWPGIDGKLGDKTHGLYELFLYISTHLNGWSNIVFLAVRDNSSLQLAACFGEVFVVGRKILAPLLHKKLH